MSVTESQAESFLTTEEAVASRIREALHKVHLEVPNLSLEQIDGVSRWIENNNRQDIYHRVDSINHQAPETRASLYRALYYKGGLREALVEGGNLDQYARGLFGFYFLSPDEQ